MTLPIISINEFTNKKINIANDIGNSCKEYGFFIIKDHDIKITDIENIKTQSKALFNLSLKDKMKYHQIKGGGQRGYTPFGIEKAKDSINPDQKEFWHHGRSNWNSKFRDIMPSNEKVNQIENFDKSLCHFYDNLDILGQKILSYIALYLGLSSNWFYEKTNQGNSILRLIHYPPSDKDNNGLRASPHEDINLITLLFGTQQEGLEILDRDNKWIPIKTDSDIVVCNVGDMLQRLTNKKFISTTHKVVNPKSNIKNISRYSMPFFIHLNPDFYIETLDSCIDDNSPNNFPNGILADDYLKERLKEINLK